MAATPIVSPSNMPSLVDKIEASAQSRLALPPGHTPSQELARYKRFLKVENARVAMMHKAGAGGRESARARAAVLDSLLRHILTSLQANMIAAGRKIPKFALVAIGGYGRGELNPLSDIDIMFLHESDQVSRGKANPNLAELTDGLLYTLWDVGLKVGHSVRSVDDAVIAANSDMQSKTSLIESRLVAGDEALFKRLEAVIMAKCVRGFQKAYIDARLEDQTARRNKFGNSPLMQEPNIKNGCGGLRDYQNLVWMTFFKFRVRSLAELEQRGLFPESERKQLEAAYDFLMLVRNELHLITKRPVDTIPKSLQPTIAHNLGYTDRSPSVRLEKFMRELYSHMRNIYLITRTMEQRLALQNTSLTLGGLLRQGKRRATQKTVDGFTISEGEICEGPRSFKEQPRRLMRVFLHAQQRGLRLHPDLAQAIRNSLSLVNREFTKDSHVSQTFLEILNQRGNVAPILRQMHDVGFLGKYLPEFGRMTCLVQHEFFHQYTADEHTLVCLEKLDRIWDAKEEPYNSYSQMFQGLEHPYLLYLALLLHDAGKGANKGGHEKEGARLSRSVARRLHLDVASTETLGLIIESHLLMVQISQRRDMDDPEVIKGFTDKLGTTENLTMLTLHTVADSLGTSDKLWNGFKDSLLQTLHYKAATLLAGGTDFIRAEKQLIQQLKDEVRPLLPPTFNPDEMEAHFNSLPVRYFNVHTARQIASDIVLAHRFMHLQMVEADEALSPVVTWHNEPDRGFTSLHICTWDRAGLFSKIAGSLTAAGLNVLNARIFSRTDGVVLDTFLVTDAATGGMAKRDERESFEAILQKMLDGSEIDIQTLIEKQRHMVVPYKSLEGDEITTVIQFDNVSAARRTIIDIETEDRVGLLYAISNTFAELGLDLALARIVTEKGAAIDSFYVRNLDGAKIETAIQQALVREKLKSAIARLA